MSRQYVSDAELAAEWPHLTRRMLRDLKDAFALFDLDGACLPHPALVMLGEKQTHSPCCASRRGHNLHL